VPELVPHLKNKSARVRIGVIRVLGQMGPVAKAALPALRLAAKEDKEEEVRKAAEEAAEKVSAAKRSDVRRLLDILESIVAAEEEFAEGLPAALHRAQRWESSGC
jgi:hypothetical protein